MSRLGEIEKDKALSNDDAVIKNSHYEWLIEQVKQNEYNKQALINQERSSDREIERLRKRVQELEKENMFQMSETHKNLDKVIYLGKENQRYKQALEFYAERDNYTTNIRDDDFNYHQAVFFDNGERARKALEDEE